MIRAPYNFVPLNDIVFTPQGGDAISQDIPFSDGESGKITIKLTAESPVYVRNGGSWPHDQSRNDDPDYQAFSNHLGNFFIPATSIKGMVRNVLEIMSLGKLGVASRVQNRAYSYRDVGNKDPVLGPLYRKRIMKPGEPYAPNVKAGWLCEYEGVWSIKPCEFARVEQCGVRGGDDGLTTLGGDIIDWQRADADNNFPAAEDKYKQWADSGQNLKISFDFKLDNHGGIKEVHQHRRVRLAYKKAIALGKGRKSGRLVFTGQGSGTKHMEFIFYDREDVDPLIVAPEIQDDFFFIHSIENGQFNDTLTFMLDKNWHRQRGIPVFYQKNGDRITSIGLTMMYRYPYDNRILDLLPENHRTDLPDLADQIFGTISGSPLKGRVQFSHALARQTTAIPGNLETRVLSSPKASYTPTYLQDGHSYNESTSRLRGWKRYPVHNDDSIVETDGTEGVSTRFRPLQKGAEFKCVVRFHNLRKPEIGALLSALTFHGNQQELFHSLGMAKPLGCGKMRLQLESIVSHRYEESEDVVFEKRELQEYLDTFVTYIEAGVQEPDFRWKAQPQVTELLTMAKEQDNRVATSSELRYMVLEMRGNNEFKDARDAGEVLPCYSQMPGISMFSTASPTDYLDIIRSALSADDVDFVQDMARTLTRDVTFLEGLKLALLELDTIQGRVKNLCNYVQYEPELIVKQKADLTNREFHDRLEKLKHPDKSSKAIQDLFGYAIFNKKLATLDGLPGYLQRIAYDWNDLQQSMGGDVYDLVDLVTPGWQWPPPADLRDYINGLPLDDEEKELLLAELDEKISLLVKQNKKQKKYLPN